MIPVKDHMTANPACVIENDPIAKARSIIRKHGYRALPVIDGVGRLVGIISRSDILRVTSSKTNLQVKGLMNTGVVTASEGDDVIRVAKMLVKYGIRQVPVVDGSKNVVGILSALDLLNAFMENQLTPVKKKIREIMNVKVVSCSPEDHVTKVWEEMLSTGYSGLPVLEKNKVVGIITRMDLLKHGSARPNKESGKNKHVPVKKIMQSRVMTASASDDTKKIASMMVENRIIRIPVVDKDMKLAGIVDIEDVLNAYVQ